MPSPSTPRRGVTQRGSAPTGKPSAAAAGSPPAPYDHNPVRDRIRQWQAQGGGVVVAADGVAEAGDEEPPVKSTPEHIPPEKAKPSPKTRTYVEYRLKDSPPPKASRQTSRKVSQVSKHSEEKLTDADAHRQSMRRNDRNRTPDRDRPRSISTPRKRVVSDEHWRAKKPSPRSAEHRKSGRLPRPSRSPRDEQEAEKDKTEDLIIKDSHDIPEYADDMGASGARVSPTPPASRTPSRHLHPPVEREIVESANGALVRGHLHLPQQKRRHRRQVKVKKLRRTIPSKKERTRLSESIAPRIERCPLRPPRKLCRALLPMLEKARK